MRVLVTGGAGFVARHLAGELTRSGHEAIMTDAVPSREIENLIQVDLTDPDAVRELVARVRPDACVHLGGVSFVPEGNRRVGDLFEVNVGSTVNLLRAVVGTVPDARFLFVSTAQVYGCSTRPDECTVDESSPRCPHTLYALSKAAAEEAVLSCARRKGLKAFIARPTNHTGVGQNQRFFIPSLVAQAREIAAGRRLAFNVGNLDGGRDFMDVRDTVRAYRLILEKGACCGIYNVSANQHRALREILAVIQRLVGTDARIETDPALFRPADFSPFLKTQRLGALGWSPEFSLEETLRDMIVRAP